MFHRPLVPLFLSLSGGIIVAHYLPPPHDVWPLFLFSALTILLICTLFLSPRLTRWALMSAFFLAGILISGPACRSALVIRSGSHNPPTLQGIVLEPPKVLPGDIARVRIRVNGIVTAGRIGPASEEIRLTVYGHAPFLQVGERIRFPARLRPFTNFENPGRFDYVSQMKSKGLTCAAYVSDGRRIVPMGQGHLPIHLRAVETLRKPLRHLFNERLSPRNSALFSAFILGERQGITPEIRQPFNRTGLGHILAVSGLHIGLVALISFFFFRTVMLRAYHLTLAMDVRKQAALLTFIPVIGYTLLAGFQVSSQRAMIMALVFLGSFVLGREREVWSTLALAGLIILFLNPDALFSISFQLSFAAVAGILWFTPVFLRLLPTPVDGQNLKRHIFHGVSIYIVGLLAVTVSATLFLLPVTALYFHQISLVSIPANMTVVPILAFWVIPSGLLCAITLPLSTAISSAFLHLGAVGLNLMMAIIEFWASLSWASIRVIVPNLFEIFLFYGLLLGLMCFKKKPWARGIVAAVLVLSFVDIGYWIYRVRLEDSLRVTFLDVGKGNSALVEFPKGKKMIIDGGGFSGGNFDVGEMVVAPFLWHSKILTVDYLVLSHPQSDHMNGLLFLARHFHPKEFWYSGDAVDAPVFKDLLRTMKEEAIPAKTPATLKGGTMINGVRVEILHPFPEENSPTERRDGKWLNNRSLVLRISYGRISFLFPGDLESAGEKKLVSRAGERLRSDVLLSPHHGSNTSSSREFLQAVDPGLCVISSGEGNPHFPHQSVLDRLRKAGCKIICTARSGAVEVEAGPENFRVETFVDSRDKQPH